MTCAFGGAAFGQDSPEPVVPTPRVEFVFHVYVDPLFGDNVAAQQYNPWASPPSLGRMQPLDQHPEPPPPPSQQKRITGVLQHAPYAFRTLTSPVGMPGMGAIEYVNTIFPSDVGWTGTNGSVRHVVIHCLPGRYGPLGSNPIDAESGLPFNGEEFPIRLRRDRVSLQGTSALDTIFDARESSVPILEIVHDWPGSVGGEASSLSSVFVDGIAFRGARPGVAGDGAAIWVRGHAIIRCSVSNCFLYDNAIGIALDASSTEEIPRVFHRMYIVNCTFAWNGIGIWAHDTGPKDPLLAAEHPSVIVNNIFDVAPRPGTYAAGFPARSCFEGIDPNCVNVVRRGSAIESFGDFNAWTPGRANTGAAAVPGWPIAPQPGAPSPPRLLPPPRVDLTAYSNWPRTFFVADALTNSPAALDTRHDLRLCPEVSPDGTAPGLQVPVVPNPCVNMGIDSGPLKNLEIATAGLTSRPLPGWGPGLTSYRPLTNGQPSPNVEEAPVTGWDFDAEGFGNPRIELPSGFPEPGDGFGDIDLGADELDRLIVAGFVDGTRMFVGPGMPNAPGFVQDHRRVFFFGRSSTSDVRPQANSLLGKEFGWFEHVQAPPDAVPLGSILNLALGHYFQFSLRFAQIGQVGRTWLMRGLECDFTPHLAMDPHPYWTHYLTLLSTPPAGPEGYASNPWFDNDTTGYTYFPGNLLSDNPALYHNRYASQGHAYQLQGFFNETFVSSAHLNPPGSFSPSGGWPSWMVAPYATFGPFGTCSGSGLNRGAWCFNDAPSGCPDTMPLFPGELRLGRRYNFEVGPGESNLQTALAVYHEEGGEGQRSGAGRTEVTNPFPTEDPAEISGRIEELGRSR